MSTARAAPAPLDLSPVRDEIASILARVAAHAAAGSCHAQAACDRGLAFELRCAASCLMTAAGLLDELRPSRVKAQA